MADSNEPASVARLRQMLRRAGVCSQDARDALGTTASGHLDLKGYLARNPGLPLWAAVALVLELDGRFTAEVLSDLNKGDPAQGHTAEALQ